MPAYVGINGKARTIAKVYQGNSDGKAEMIYGPYGPARYSKDIENLSESKAFLTSNCSASIGDYVLFAGGEKDSTAFSNIDCYSSTLTKISVDSLSLSKARAELATTTVGNYALFAGGVDPETSTYYATVDVYDKDLTKTTATDLTSARAKLAASNNSSCALFAGGMSKSTVAFATVDTYDASLTKWTATTLSSARYNLSGGSIGTSYALFACGFTGSDYSNIVDTYNCSLLTKTTLTTMPDKVAVLASVSVQTLQTCLFAGGRGLSLTSACNGYNLNLTRINLQDLSEKKGFLSGAKLSSNYALFAGGLISGGSSDLVDVYDILSYTKTNSHNLKYSRNELSGGSVGDYALFIGGSTHSSTVDAYYIYE